jgi:predicted TIM-barrel fold metal-dependent hydrolase
MTDEEKQAADQWAFETFASAYPHEAAELDWARFVAFTQSKNPQIPEHEIKRLLAETAEERAK